MSDDHPFYPYDPNRGAALAFAIIFTVTTAQHLFQCIKTKTWYFTAFIIGGIFEAVGYLARYISVRNETSKTAFIVQYLLILIAPALLAASLYMLLSRLILVTRTEALCPLRRKWLTRIFVGGDILSFLVQVLGGGIIATGTAGDTPDDKKIKLGEHVVIVGLVVQLVFFAVFLVVGVWWRRRAVRHGMGARVVSVPWPRHYWALVAASTLVFLRSVFRLLEYAMGTDSVLLKHEVFLYVFDAVPMAVVMMLENAVHPGVVTKALRGEQPVEVCMDSGMAPLPRY